MSWLCLFADITENITKITSLVIAVWLLALYIIEGLTPLGGLFILIKS